MITNINIHKENDMKTIELQKEGNNKSNAKRYDSEAAAPPPRGAPRPTELSPTKVEGSP